ncbi:dihydroorotase [Patescibacteria group bacterium]|nr:dihydroorotase [Patescibacteria group bacterium]
MKQVIRIDPHVHCRDGKQAYKETIAHVFELVKEENVRVIIIEMPNTDPPILIEEDIWRRLKLVPPENEDNYFLWLGLTANVEQIKKAVCAYYEYRQVVGFKLYAGRSTGDLAVVKEKDQEMIYATLTSLEYEGPIAVHCEKEAFINEMLFNPLQPYTHSLARPKVAEIASIQDQIRFVKKTGFKGTLHICHVSCSESVELIDAARKDIKITCGVTPHHILWDGRELNTSEGLLYKTNPPLRDRIEVLGLIECLKAGKIDWIETDHAPHSIGEKLHSNNPPSGYPSLYIYKEFVEVFLPDLGVNRDLIKKMTCDNIIRTLKLEL